MFKLSHQNIIQPKLKIGQPNDRFEQEADAVADQVMQMPQSPPPIQRKCEECEEEELQMKPLSASITPIIQKQSKEQEGELQMKQLGTSTEYDPNLQSSLQRSKGGGQPLPESTQSFMNRSIGADFSSVKIHTDSEAIQMNRSLGAKAFTNGSDVYFNEGQYNPGSSKGKKLLGHELTHVVQQNNFSDRSSQHFQGSSSVVKQPVVTSSISKPEIVQLDRDPDLSTNGLDTFFLGTSSNPRVVATQIGLSPGDARVTLKLSALSQALSNGPVAERTMPLSIHPTVPRHPVILSETETELDTNAYQNVIALKLNDTPEIPQVTLILHHSRSSQMIPFPEGAFGVWRRTMVESCRFQITDGFNEMTVNFPGEIPGSFYSSAFRPSQHPGLGHGYIGPPGNTFYPYPRRPTNVDLRDTIRFVIHMTPVIGTLVMVGEALVGRDIWGRRISTLERALLGAGALLSVIAPLFRAGRTAISAVTAANNLSRVGGISTIRALWMIRGARNLSAVERARLVTFAQKVRAGEALTQAELTAANRILGKMEEPLRIASIRAEVAATSGVTQQAGRYTDLAVTTSAAETRVGQILARDLRDDVVRVPESTTQGRRVGDYLIGNQTAELYSPTTGNMQRLLNVAQSKQKQAGTIIIDLAESTVTTSPLTSNIPRLFGRPSFSADRVIIIEGNQISATILRQVAATPSQASGATIRGATSIIGQEATDR